jgi:5-methyltetrahydrofolate--homocysteine methyltransferase
MNVTIAGAYRPDGPVPRAPLIGQENCTDLSYTACEVIERIDYELQGTEFLGDSFPYYNLLAFGPGVLSVFCGATLDNSSGRVWFFPKEELPIEDIHVRYDPNNKWVRRIKDIYRAGLAKWHDQVLMGMTDLGSVLDTAATLRGSENLMMDFYDAPEEVLRLCEEIHIAWHEAYRDLESVLESESQGYTHWSGLYSTKPSYTIQSDFSYMISTEMFNKFTLPFLVKDCDLLGNTIYHLDGVGNLPHLDSLLSIKKLDAVQWVPGDGKPGPGHWIDVYQRIEASGKGIQIIGGPEDFAEVYPKIKKNVYFIYAFENRDPDLKNRLEKINLA